jgi:hypothetical protein
MIQRSVEINSRHVGKENGERTYTKFYAHSCLYGEWQDRVALSPIEYERTNRARELS